MDRTEFYRLLAADHFDLLDAGEKARLESAIPEHSDVQRAAFLRRLKAAFDAGIELDQEVRFLDAVAAAQQPGADDEPDVLSRPARPARTGWTGWRLALAGAAGAAAVWIGVLIVGQPDRSAPVDPAGQPVVLNAARSGSEDTVDLSATSAPHLTLIAEVRIEDPMVRWEFRHGQTEVLESGTIEFTAVSQPLRLISIQIPKRDLVTSIYWLILLDDEGDILRQWSVQVR